MVETARKDDLDSVLLTFFPHPRLVLQKDGDLKLINTLTERKQILKTIGIDHLVVQPFNKEFSRLTALEFVRDILVNNLNAKKIIIGYDHRFGRNRNANIDHLREFGITYGFEVEEISAQELNEVAVSSTKIRKALEAGDITTANNYLGYPFMLNGTVERGKGIGSTLNYPTANLKIDNPNKLIPKKGVYLVRSVSRWKNGLWAYKHWDQSHFRRYNHNYRNLFYGGELLICMTNHFGSNLSLTYEMRKSFSQWRN